LSDLVQRAAVLHGEQRIEEALEAIGHAVQAEPDNAQAVFGLAQLSFEAWRPAADFFARARALIAGQPDLIRNHALALAAEGESAAAEQLLERELADNLGWLDGHKTLASLRITTAATTNFDQSYADACHAQPQNASLWMGWFQQHVALNNWDRARDILARAQRAVGANRSLEMAALFLDSEGGAGKDLSSRFAAFADQGDPGMDLCHVRYCLKSGAADAALAIAMRQLSGPAARMFWPYIALCWRLLGDERAAWLDGDPLYAKVLDLNFSESELATLAAVLRGLHRLRAPYPEQSVRGGTQTDRQLFFHPDPAIQNARVKIAKAVEGYMAALPPLDPHHPLLAFRRDTILFEGSWSVRLAGGGNHNSHTHMMGWISSAFYVALPEAMSVAMDEAPAGWLSLGAPPPELKLGLKPYVHIQPQPGRLVLFPSTLWHATEPFAEGERLTIAFDIKIPC
jgi:tetratricopeptide (TPR) repeat protein